MTDPLEAEVARLRAEVERLERERDEALAAASRADDWFRLLAESMPLLVFTGRPDGVIDYVNPAFWDFIGIRPDQASLEVGAWLNYLHADDRESTAEVWARSVATGEEYVTAFRIRRADGEYRWHDVLAYPVVGDDGEIMAWFGAAADVHDRTLAEAALAEREVRLRAILEHEPDALSVTGSDGRILELNRAGHEMLEIDDLAELDGVVGVDFVHPDDLERYKEFVARVFAGNAESIDLRLVGRRGTVRWVESRAVTLARDSDQGPTVLAVTRDITDRRRDQVIERAETAVHAGLLAGASLDDLVSELLTALDEVIDGRCAALFADDGHVSGGVAVGMPAGFVGACVGMALDPEAGACVKAAERGGPVVAADLGADGLWSGLSELVVPTGLVSCLPIPVVDGSGEAVAVLTLFRRHERLPSPGEQMALDRVVRLIGLAIERVRSEVALQRTAMLLNVASELGRLGGWSVDIPPTTVVWSDEVAAIHGLPAGYSPPVEEGISYYAPEHQPIISEAFRSCADDGVPYDLELEIIDAEGTRKWVRTVGRPERDGAGRIVRVIGAFQDITEAKRSVAALAESEERFRLLSQATSDVVFDWDIGAGEVWYGDGRERLFGDSGGPMIAAAMAMERLHAKDRQRVTDRFMAVIRSGDDRWSDEFRILRPDGVQIPLRGSGFVLRDATGRATRVIGSLVDLTVEHELQGRLAQAQRLEAVGQLTGGVAHDFNNLLTVIIGNVDLLGVDLADGDPPDRDELVQIAETIGTAARRGADLTRQLLAFARRQPLDPVEVDVDAVVERLGRLLRRTLGEDISVRVTCAATRPAMADASQLDAALLNICINARDAMAGGGSLTIETSQSRVAVPGEASAGNELLPGDYVVIAITDSGSGMPPEVADRVFDPFFSTKAPGRGTGLGLSMVYGFAKQSGGHVEIDSRLGRGTTVRLWLPVAGAAAPDDPAPPDVDRASRRGGRERILLVEDEDLVREVVAAQLRTLGYQVVEAVDGPSALALARDGAFDLLFTDVVMPGGMNGFELAQAAVSMVPGLPVLLTSGYADDQVVLEGAAARGWLLLSKPYRFDQLAAHVRATLDAVVSEG